MLVASKNSRRYRFGLCRRPWCHRSNIRITSYAWRCFFHIESPRQKLCFASQNLTNPYSSSPTSYCSHDRVLAMITRRMSRLTWLIKLIVRWGWQSIGPASLGYRRKENYTNLLAFSTLLFEILLGFQNYHVDAIWLHYIFSITAFTSDSKICVPSMFLLAKGLSLLSSSKNVAISCDQWRPDPYSNRSPKICI